MAFGLGKLGRLGLVRGGGGGVVVPPNTLLAGVGTFLLAGDDMTPLVDHTLAASGGTYTYTGQDASLLRSTVLAAGGGTYAYTGQDATLTKASGGATLTFRSAPAVQWGNNLDFTDIPIGIATSDRLVIVCVQVAHNTGNTIAITIGGNSPTASGVGAEGGDYLTDIFYYNLTSGTTCTVNVTASIGSGGSTNIGACNIVVYTLTGVAASPTTTADDTAYGVVFANPMTVGAVTVPSGGATIAAIGADRAVTATWGSDTADAQQVGRVGVNDINLFTLSTTTSGSKTYTSNNQTTFYSAVMMTWGP